MTGVRRWAGGASKAAGALLLSGVLIANGVVALDGPILLVFSLPVSLPLALVGGLLFHGGQDVRRGHQDTFAIVGLGLLLAASGSVAVHHAWLYEDAGDGFTDPSCTAGSEDCDESISIRKAAEWSTPRWVALAVALPTAASLAVLLVSRNRGLRPTALAARAAALVGVLGALGWAVSMELRNADRREDACEHVAAGTLSPEDPSVCP